MNTIANNAENQRAVLRTRKRARRHGRDTTHRRHCKHECTIVETATIAYIPRTHTARRHICARIE
jgi:hypothetical protein